MRFVVGSFRLRRSGLVAVSASFCGLMGDTLGTP